MAKAAQAITKTFLKEGKLSYSNHDTGGLTYLGLAYNKWPNASLWPAVFKIIQSVKNIPDSTLKTIGVGGPGFTLTVAEEDKINQLLEPFRKEVIGFYKKEFWDVLNADRIIAQSFAESFFDFSVNVGSGTGAILLQEYLGVKADGDIGPKTITKLNNELLKNTYNVNIDFTLIKIRKYGRIVSKNPAQIKNLHGWLNRAFEVFSDIYSIDIIIDIQTNIPEAIPEDLKGDISKLIDIYRVNLEYDKTRDQSTLERLQKITETI